MVLHFHAIWARARISSAIDAIQECPLWRSLLRNLWGGDIPRIRIAWTTSIPNNMGLYSKTKKKVWWRTAVAADCVRCEAVLARVALNVQWSSQVRAVRSDCLSMCVRARIRLEPSIALELRYRPALVVCEVAWWRCYGSNSAELRTDTPLRPEFDQHRPSRPGIAQSLAQFDPCWAELGTRLDQIFGPGSAKFGVGNGADGVPMSVLRRDRRPMPKLGRHVSGIGRSRPGTGQICQVRPSSATLGPGSARFAPTSTNIGQRGQRMQLPQWLQVPPRRRPARRRLRPRQRLPQRLRPRRQRLSQRCCDLARLPVCLQARPRGLPTP